MLLLQIKWPRRTIADTDSGRENHTASTVPYTNVTYSLLNERALRRQWCSDTVTVIACIIKGLLLLACIKTILSAVNNGFRLCYNGYHSALFQNNDCYPQGASESE